MFDYRAHHELSGLPDRVPRPWGAKGEVAAAQVAWLRQELAASQSRGERQVAEEELEEEDDDEEKPQWMEESARKMQAFRDGTTVLPGEKRLPPLFQYGNPWERLPPFKRLNATQMAEMSVKNLPGCWSGMKFPHKADQLESFGAAWYTEAFHRFGTLPKDNVVTEVVSVEPLPYSGFDAAGGAGQKAFVTLKYLKPDPNLHTKLFAKMPWDYFESETAKRERMQISTYNDNDSVELLTSMCLELLLPFRIPKLYFCDINRDTTNYVLITERIPFGKRGKMVHGRVEKVRRKPFEVLPVCGKYQDYLLEDPPKIYYALFREMAHLAAWDHHGRYDDLLGPRQNFTMEQTLSSLGSRKPLKKKRIESVRNSADLMMSQAIDFALNVAPQIFTRAGKDKQQLQKMKDEIMEFAPFFDDLKLFLGSDSDYVAAMHANLQADNAYFWPDEHGDLDIGVFDWCAFGRVPFILLFMGCLSGAEAAMLDEHEAGLMQMFCDEYKRYGGPHINVEDLLLRYQLNWPMYAMDCGQWVERAIYVECSKEEFRSIRSVQDDKFVSRWSVRCRGTALINALEFYHRRDFRKVWTEWMNGVGQAFISQVEEN
mmetsp:Transcript_84336/g.187322  ORF Transcript_84336/g.187322 Transcript_84336/m.187322 type:complete len:599 (-) Transcript_84336:18-1814(-)